MIRDEIIKMAREADLIDFRDEDDDPHTKQMVEFLQRFATLVAAAEREACAKVCRSEADRALFNFRNDLPQNESFWNGAEQMASGCENHIRARSNT